MNGNIEKEIHDMLIKNLQKALDSVHQKILNSLKNKVYSRYGVSEYYDRTYDLLNAFTNPPKIDIKNNGDVIFKLWDSDKIVGLRSTNPQKLNAHMSINGSTKVNGENISDLLPIWFDKGKYSPIHSTPATGFMSSVFRNSEQMNSYIESEILRYSNAEYQNIAQKYLIQ